MRGDSEVELDPLVPEGEYRLKLVNHFTEKMFGNFPKLVLEFEVLDYGEHFGILLRRFYCVSKLKGKPGKKGKFIPPKRGDFLIEYCTLLGKSKLGRLDRIPMQPLYGRIIVGETRNVTHNNQQKALPAPLQYSVVARLLRVES